MIYILESPFHSHLSEVVPIIWETINYSEEGKPCNKQEASGLLKIAAHKCTFASNVGNKSEMIYDLSHTPATFNIFERH